MARNERETRERAGGRERDRSARGRERGDGDDRRAGRDTRAARGRDRDDDRRTARKKIAGGRGSKKPPYVYKPRSADSIRERGERQVGRFDSIFKQGVDTWRAKVGDNLIRFLPPTWKDYEHYGYKIWVHKYVGANESSYLCLKLMNNKRCPVCEAEKEARDAGEIDEAKRISAKEDYVSWIIDRDNDPDKPMLFQYSWMMDRDIAAICYDKRRGDTLHIDHHEQGYDVTIKRQGTGLRTRYYGFTIDREPSPISDDEDVQDDIMRQIIAEPVPSMLNFYSETHLDDMMSGTSETRDEELDEEEEETEEEEEEEERPRGKKKRRARDVEEEEEPETEEASDEESEEEEPDEEEGDEEADEDEGGDEDDSGEEEEEDDGDDDDAPRRRAPPAREREPARARGRDNGGGKRERIASRPSRPAPAQRGGRAGGRSSGRYRD